jgi:hypothetical protein
VTTPETCATCGGSGDHCPMLDCDSPCPVCKGTGKAAPVCEEIHDFPRDRDGRPIPGKYTFTKCGCVIEILGTVALDSAPSGAVSEERVHELKTLPLYFNEIVCGRKRFEVRKDDRGFHVGDTLVLREWIESPPVYSGRESRWTVGYILRGPLFGIEAGHVVMSLVDQRRPTEEMRLTDRFGVTVELRPDIGIVSVSDKHGNCFGTGPVNFMRHMYRMCHEAEYPHAAISQGGPEG